MQPFSTCDRPFPRYPAPMRKLSLTAVLEREGDGFVSLCHEVDVASQGDSVEDALANLREAVELFLEEADTTEIERRIRGEGHASNHGLTACPEVALFDNLLSLN